MNVRRPEWLLCALFGGVLGGFANAYWALQPTRVLQVRLLLGLLSLTWLVKAFTARPLPGVPGEGPPETRGRRWGLGLVRLGLGLGLGLTIIWMHAASYTNALIISAPPALATMVTEAVALMVCGWLSWRRPALRPAVTGAVATVLFAGSFLFVVLNVWMWMPPETSACEALLRPDEVERLSPVEWVQEPSHPFRLLYIPEESWLVAAFKMGGTGHLTWWDVLEANRVMGVDIRAPETIGVLPLAQTRLPEHITYHSGRREILLSRMGPGVHSLDVLGVADFPRLTLDRTVFLDYAPHEVVSHPASGTYGVVGQHGQFVTLGDETLEPLRSLGINRPGDHVAVPLFAWQAPGSDKAYLSFLIYPLAEIDLQAGTIRWSEDTMFGGGQLVGSPETGELFVTDMLFNRVDVLDRETLKVTRRLALDYTPRAVQVASARDLLMVGDWFDGVVRFYRLSTLEPLDTSVPVGPYLRDLAYDPARGLLFTASKCGVLQVHIDKLSAGEGRR